jgi:hypothetical protein
MGKIVKLNITDIENIVKKTIKESEEFETQNNDEPEFKKTMVIGKGDDGKIYAIDSESGEILGVK